MHNRLKQIRKSQKMTQAEFGNTLGVKRDAYASYESGRVTPSKTFLSLLCQTYNVNESWIVDGTGSMFVGTQEEYIDELVARYNGGALLKNIVSSFMKLNEAERSAVLKFIDGLPTEDNENADPLFIERKVAASSTNDEVGMTAKIPATAIQKADTADGVDDDEL